MAERHRVVFTPSGLEGVVDDGVSVLDAARSLGVDLDTVCGGRGICGRCQVTASPGAHAKWNLIVGDDALGPPGETEIHYRGGRVLLPGRRLGCAAPIRGDAVIDVPLDSQVHRQVIRKDLDLGLVEVDPRFTLMYVEVPVSRLGDSLTAEQSLLAALADQHPVDAGGTVIDRVATSVLGMIHGALASASGEVTVAVEPGDAAGEPSTVVAVWPGFVDTAYGVAVDIGSTTVAAHLCDLTSGEVLTGGGVMNPQIRFGEDLMSRVSYVMMNPGAEREMTAAIRTAVDDLAGTLLDQAAVQRDRVLEIVLVGNPIMHHLLLGIDPTPLGSAPFVLATDRAVSGAASGLDLDLPYASYYVGPCIAGHVGADTAAAILAEAPHHSDRMQLLVDVGTNAEIVLGDRSRVFAASSPTGPAFEGAQISCGQRATAGAIERVRIDRETLEPRFRVIGLDRWSDEEAFWSEIADVGITGVCGSGIIEVIAEMFLAGIIDSHGVIRPGAGGPGDRIVADGRTSAYLLHADTNRRLLITQNDVRAIQLAKAALRAGIDLLVEHAGSPVVDDVRLAGAFGTHIDPLYAMLLGLVPDCPLDGIRSVGNAAGAGAVRALLSSAARRDMEFAVRSIDKIETATEPRFQELFVAAMAFPHGTALSPHLAAVVTLPEPSRDRLPVDGRPRRRRNGAPAAAPAREEAP